MVIYTLATLTDTLPPSKLCNDFIVSLEISSNSNLWIYFFSTRRTSHSSNHQTMTRRIFCSLSDESYRKSLDGFSGICILKNAPQRRGWAEREGKYQFSFNDLQNGKTQKRRRIWIFFFRNLSNKLISTSAEFHFAFFRIDQILFRSWWFWVYAGSWGNNICPEVYWKMFLKHRTSAVNSRPTKWP